MAFAKRKIRAGTLTPNRQNKVRFGKATIADFFSVRPHYSASDGSAVPAGATGSVNILRSGPNTYEWHVKGAGQTITAPVYDLTSGNGLDFGQDQTATEGHELSFSPNITAALAAYKVAGSSRIGKHGFIVSGDTGGFYARLRFKCSDVSGIAGLFFGFVGAQAYQTALASYADFAGIDFNVSGTTAKVQTKTQSNTAGVTNVDSGQTIADNDVVDVRIEVLGGAQMGQVRFFWAKNATRADLVGAPAITQSFTLRGTAAAPLVYRPATFFLHGADLADNLFYQEFECGYLPTNAA